MTAITRAYKIKDVDMLIAAATITETAITYKNFLQEKRSSWADPYFETFRNRISLAMQHGLGADHARELRQATQQLVQLQKQALTALSLLKLQITEDFKNEQEQRAELLKQLGFTDFLKKARQGDQEALIRLLFQFSQNLSGTMKQELITRGISASLSDEIISLAARIKDANVLQEGQKGRRKSATGSTIAEFNAIYLQAVSICKIAARFYNHNPAIREQFSFAKRLKALNKEELTIKQADTGN